ncbi:MAG: hypothetical protein ABR926_24770, partial [Streptosporangiaceae bacterium]
MAAIEAILAGCEALRPAQEALYQDLHCHRELCHQETRTPRAAGGPDHQPLAEVPAPDAAHPANRHRGPARLRAGLARALT